MSNSSQQLGKLNLTEGKTENRTTQQIATAIA